MAGSSRWWYLPTSVTLTLLILSVGLRSQAQNEGCVETCTARVCWWNLVNGFDEIALKRRDGLDCRKTFIALTSSDNFVPYGGTASVPVDEYEIGNKDCPGLPYGDVTTRAGESCYWKISEAGITGCSHYCIADGTED